MDSVSEGDWAALMGDQSSLFVPHQNSDPYFADYPPSEVPSSASAAQVMQEEGPAELATIFHSSYGAYQPITLPYSRFLTPSPSPDLVEELLRGLERGLPLSVIDEDAMVDTAQGGQSGGQDWQLDLGQHDGTNAFREQLGAGRRQSEPAAMALYGDPTTIAMQGGSLGPLEGLMMDLGAQSSSRPSLETRRSSHDSLTAIPRSYHMAPPVVGGFGLGSGADNNGISHVGSSHTSGLSSHTSNHQSQLGNPAADLHAAATAALDGFMSNHKRPVEEGDNISAFGGGSAAAGFGLEGYRFATPLVESHQRVLPRLPSYHNSPPQNRAYYPPPLHPGPSSAPASTHHSPTSQLYYRALPLSSHPGYAGSTLSTNLTAEEPLQQTLEEHPLANLAVLPPQQKEVLVSQLNQAQYQYYQQQQQAQAQAQAYALQQQQQQQQQSFRNPQPLNSQRAYPQPQPFQTFSATSQAAMALGLTLGAGRLPELPPIRAILSPLHPAQPLPPPPPLQRTLSSSSKRVRRPSAKSRPSSPGAVDPDAWNGVVATLKQGATGSDEESGEPSDSKSAKRAKTSKQTRKSRNPHATQLPCHGSRLSLSAHTLPGGIKPEEGVPPKCKNCSAVSTPLWRRGGDDELLCNA